MFFSLDKDLLDDSYYNMVRENVNDECMDQDSGYSELHGKRGVAKATSDASGSGWEYVSPPTAMVGGYVANSPEVPRPHGDASNDGLSADSVQMTMPIKKDKIRIKDAQAAKDVIPVNFEHEDSGASSRMRQMGHCYRRNQGRDLTAPLERLYEGKAVNRKGCVTQYVQLRFGEATRTSQAVTMAASASTATLTMTSAGRIFRSSAAAPLPQGAKEKDLKARLKDPRTGLQVPQNLEVGKPNDGLACVACGAPMVLRRVGHDDGLCFASANFSTKSIPTTFFATRSASRSWAMCPSVEQDPERNGMISPFFQWFAYGAREEDLREVENSFEPNTRDADDHANSEFENSFEAREDMHHLLQPTGNNHDLDESRVCPLDTACTACMHAKRWREAYQRTLPTGALCQPTPLRKGFHFADGGSTEEKLVVWKIPVYFENFAGEVFSTEVPRGSTPLLLSSFTRQRARWRSSGWG